MGKIQFKPSNYHKYLIFILQLENWITEAIQLSKLGKFDLLGGFEFFKKLRKFRLDFLKKSKLIHFKSNKYETGIIFF